MAYEFGDFSLDPRTCQLHGPAGVIALEPRVFDLLAYLVRNHGRLVTKAELYQAIWSNRVVSEASLPVAMTAVRRALGDDSVGQRFVATHRGRGYRFVHPVRDAVATTQPEATATCRDRYVGREAERALLRDMFATSRSGRLQMLVIGGEPGIGKSRLLRQLSTEMESLETVVLLGRSPEEAGAPAFWPWIQVLRHHFAGSSPAGIAPLLAGIEDIAHLLPELRARIASPVPPALGDPLQARFRLFDAIATCVDRAARRNPTTILLDDIHRADEASLLLLTYIARALGDSPLLIVATYRDTGRSSLLSKTLATLAREPASRSIRLGGLGPSECALFLESIAGRAFPPSLASALHERTQGNPLFLVQLARHNTDACALDLAHLPTDLLSALALQVQDLSSSAKELLAAAAVIGTEFSLAALAEVVQADIADLMPVLEQPISCDVVVVGESPSTYRFRHALLRDALYQGIAPARRSVLHATTAQTLSRIHGDGPGRHLAVIAHHFVEAAGSGVCHDSVDFSIRAGDYAASCLAYEESADHYRRALELIDLAQGAFDELKPPLMVRLAAQLTKSGNRSGAREVFERVLGRRDGAPHLLAEAALSLAPGVLALESGVVDSFLIDLLGAALVRAQPHDHRTRARLLARQSQALHWSDDRSIARDRAIESRAIAEAAGDPESLASAIQAEWSSLHGPDHVDERYRLASDLFSRRCLGATAETTLVSHLFGVYSALEYGDCPSADTHVAAFRKVAAQLRQPQGLWFATMLDAMKAQLRGDFQLAAELQARFTALGATANDANAVHSALAHATYLAYVKGDVAALLPAAEQIAERFPSVDVWKAAVVWMMALLGKTDGARLRLDAFGHHWFATHRQRMDFNGTLCLLGEAAALVGDRDLAHLIYERLLPLATRHVLLGLGTLCWGSAARVLGMLAASLGHSRDAIRHLRQAVVLNDRIDARPWRAHSQVELGRLLAMGGATGHDESRALLGEALASAQLLGMTNLEDRIHALMLPVN